MNYEEPIHRIIGGIVHSPAFADKLPQQREFYNLTPPEYWELLHAHASAFRMWKVTYMHTLPPDVYLEVQHPCWSCNSNSSSANASAGVR